MLVSDAITYGRILLATPGGTAVRWTDSQLTTLYDRAVKAVVAETYFPESRLTITTTVANQQEYQLPEMHAIYRVYVNAQPIAKAPGGVDTLEGVQIDFYDSTGQGTSTTGSGGPTNASGPMQAQWVVQTPVAYPYINTWGAPAAMAQPYFPGQSPRWYTRGGFIGIVPAIGPVGTVITIDGVRVPSTLTSTSQTIVVPDNFMEALQCFVLWRAAAADNSDTAEKNRQAAYVEYDREIRKLRTWKRQYSTDNDQIFPQTYRGAYRIGGHKAGDGTYDY